MERSYDLTGDNEDVSYQHAGTGRPWEFYQLGATSPKNGTEKTEQENPRLDGTRAVELHLEPRRNIQIALDPLLQKGRWYDTIPWAVRGTSIRYPHTIVLE